jgi:hypothetical protein
MVRESEESTERVVADDHRGFDPLIGRPNVDLADDLTHPA